jgi:peroxiredoxin
MTIEVGGAFPALTLKTNTADGIDDLDTAEFFKGRKVVLFAVPGAFTPTCSVQHLPGFVQKADALKAKGIDRIACTAVNDAFVMGAWAKDQGAGDVITMIADGNGDLAKTLGLEMDVSVAGLGMRSQRYAMVVDDGTVTKLFVEEPRAFEVSSAEHVLANI